MSTQTAKRLCFKSLMLLPWLAICLCHANETVFVPKAEQVFDNVYAIIGPLGQRSQANAGLNANYGL